MTSVGYATLGVVAFVVFVVLFVVLSLLLEKWDDMRLARHMRKQPGMVPLRAKPSPSVSLDPRDGYTLDDPKLRAFDGRWS